MITLQNWEINETAVVSQTSEIAYGQMLNDSDDTYAWVGLWEEFTSQYVAWHEVWLISSGTADFSLAVDTPNRPILEYQVYTGHRADLQYPIVPDTYMESFYVLTVCPEATQVDDNMLLYLLAGTVIGGGLVYLARKHL